MSADLIVEADGGSRGNPGPAAYGAVVRDPATGRALVEVAEYIGETTNNVAEYRGLLAGLRAAVELDPAASIEARLDSRLVVEQMSGRWAIKNSALRSIALEARRVSDRVRFTWVPREANGAADALVNEVLDGVRAGRPGSIVRYPSRETGIPPSDDVVGEIEEDLSRAERPQRHALVGWASDLGTPTVTLLGRHGATHLSLEKRFSGLGGLDAPLAPIGVAQAQALASELVVRGGADAIVASPLLRTRQTAEIVARELNLDVDVEEGLAECAFGAWDGLTFAEVHERWPDEVRAWLGSTDVAPPGGESFEHCRARVDAARQRVTERFTGQRVIVISHVTPIKILTGIAVDAPLHSLYRMELAPCSLSTIAWFPDGVVSLFGFAEQAHLRDVDAGSGV